VENGAYLGVALIVVLLVLVSRERTSRRVQLATCLAVISGVLSLGRYLVVDGHGGRIPLPFDLLAHLSGTDNILPIRFSFTTVACVAAVLAFGLDNLHGRDHDRPFDAPQHGHSAALSSVSGLTVVFLVVVVTWLPTWPYPTQAVKMLPTAVTRTLPGDDPLVLTYPYPVSPEDQAYLWQAGARFSFRLLGVYGLVPGFERRATYLPPLLSPPAVQEFLVANDGFTNAYYPAPPPLKRVVSQTRIFVARWDVKAVIVNLAAPRGRTVADMFAAAFGRPVVTSGQFDLWTFERRFTSRRPRS
jgi:hypothetical protein